MKAETTFAKLHEAGACKGRYKHLARALGGITRYGRNTPITLAQIVEHNGLDDAEWALDERAVDLDDDACAVLRLYAADCADRALLRERAAGREPDARSWAAVEAARAYAGKEIGEVTLGAAKAAAWDAARATAWDAARAAARATAWDAEREWQAARLLAYLRKEVTP